MLNKYIEYLYDWCLKYMSLTPESRPLTYEELYGEQNNEAQAIYEMIIMILSK